MVMWGDMSRRNISFTVKVPGDPLNSFSKDWIDIATKQPAKQSLVYSNSAKTCDGAIMNRLSSARRKLTVNNRQFFFVHR